MSEGVGSGERVEDKKRHANAPTSRDSCSDCQTGFPLHI